MEGPLPPPPQKKEKLLSGEVDLNPKFSETLKI